MRGFWRKKGLKAKKRATKQTQTQRRKRKPRKRKKNCCTRCVLGICNWFCRRIKRRIRRKLFGPPKINLEEFETADVNFDAIKDYFPEKKLSNQIKNLSVLTIFKNHKKLSKLNISLSHLDLIEGLEAEDLKKKFSIKGSRGTLLEQMVEDYKKGNLSSAGLSDKSKFNFKKLDKDRINSMLDAYKEQKMKSKISLKLLNVNELKRKHSLSTSKEKILQKVIADYKKGKISQTAMVSLQRLRSKKLSKEELNKILQNYEKTQKKKRITLFPGLSKISEFKSAIGDAVKFSF
ncbi:uncharacterized protein LOC110385869 [Bombyx mori]|uniref:Uncharacterized protein n=1 Tax=Bombyx mori TaxID=7091 RepID=A0A8R2HNG5_BOMMO|nr:uncharacterized protein LOC110385869 [Bombyx mori]